MIDLEKRYVGLVLEGRFRVDSLLAQGGMGVVFLGTDLSNGEQVAIKFLRLSLDPVVYRRFEREAEVIASFDHPNLVKLIAQGVDEDLPYLVLEFVPGISLGQVLLQGRLSVQATVQMGLAISSALAHAHERGVVHRDLKPDNILIQEKPDGGYTAKLVDFGVAHAVSDNTAITRVGSICGTPGYVSPEQIVGKPVTPSADLYALGVVFFECITGTRAFKGKSPMQVLFQQSQAAIPALSSFPHLVVPLSLQRLISSLLEREPSERPATARDVIASLEPILDLRDESTERLDTIEMGTTDKYERIEDDVSVSVPIRVGGGWDELLSGPVEKNENVGGVIDPQLFDVNPKELDVVFEFTSLISVTGSEDEKPVERATHGWEADAGPPIAKEDYSDLSLARPVRDPVKEKPVEAPQAAGGQSVLSVLAIVVVVSLLVVAVFYWRAKVRSTTMPPDVAREAARPIKEVTPSMDEEETDGEETIDEAEPKSSRKKRSAKKEKTGRKGTKQNPMELFDK